MQIAVDEVSVDKSVRTHMKESLSHTSMPSVRYGANAVKYVTELKYLGLTVRERLNFSYHLQ